VSEAVTLGVTVAVNVAAADWLPLLLSVAMAVIVYDGVAVTVIVSLVVPDAVKVFDIVLDGEAAPVGV